MKEFSLDYLRYVLEKERISPVKFAEMMGWSRQVGWLKRTGPTKWFVDELIMLCERLNARHKTEAAKSFDYYPEDFFIEKGKEVKARCTKKRPGRRNAQSVLGI